MALKALPLGVMTSPGLPGWLSSVCGSNPGPMSPAEGDLIDTSASSILWKRHSIVLSIQLAIHSLIGLNFRKQFFSPFTQMAIQYYVSDKIRLSLCTIQLTAPKSVTTLYYLWNCTQSLLSYTACNSLQVQTYVPVWHSLT